MPINTYVPQKNFEIIDAGLFTCLQDLGRERVSQYGVGQSGALDETSFLWANWLCSNKDNTPCLEILLGGLTLKVLRNTTIALTGANAPLFINGELLLTKNQSIAGDHITLNLAMLSLLAKVQKACAFI